MFGTNALPEPAALQAGYGCARQPRPETFRESPERREASAERRGRVFIPVCSGGRRSGGHFRRPFIPAGWTWTPGRTCPRGVPNPPGRPRLCRLWHRPTQSRADQGPTIDRAHSLPLMMCGFKSRSDPTLPRAPRPRRMSFDRSMWTGFRKLPACVSRSRIVRLSDVVFSRTLLSHGT